MKPTRAQYFFASGTPLQVLFALLFIGAPVCLTYVVASVLSRVYAPLSNIWNLIRWIFYVADTLILTFLLAMVAGSVVAGIFWLFLRPLYNARCMKNGAPFHVGDHVRILSGRYRNQVVRVYSDWRDDSVRVDLGDKAKEKFKDIYSAIQLLRENIEHDAPPNSRPPSQLSPSPEVQPSDSLRMPSSGGCG